MKCFLFIVGLYEQRKGCVDLISKGNLPKLSPTATEIIKQAIQACPTSNRSDICSKVGEILQEKYLDSNKRSKMASLGMETTTEIKEKIDSYMLKQMVHMINKGEFDDDCEKTN